MNPEIGDYLSTAARDHLNVFCFIMAISLLWYVLLDFTKGEVCAGENLLLVSTNGIYVLTLKW